MKSKSFLNDYHHQLKVVFVWRRQKVSLPAVPAPPTKNKNCPSKSITEEKPAKDARQASILSESGTNQLLKQFIQSSTECIAEQNLLYVILWEEVN